MCYLHFVQYRFKFNGVPILKLKVGDRERVFRNVRGTYIAEQIDENWITLKGMEGNGMLRINDAEALWDDLMLDVEVKRYDSWRTIESWEEINAELQPLPRAAE